MEMYAKLFYYSPNSFEIENLFNLKQIDSQSRKKGLHNMARYTGKEAVFCCLDHIFLLIGGKEASYLKNLCKKTVQGRS